ncbi:surfeit locus protein 6 isoform X2 [Scleropages formosus]|uniref:Surfeit 6 n=2 Tax=Scleropages formosus TaxID=113540 RepID=A0A8C9SS83_SCLFO|nr:surfeit locus protein 6 isoform X2 [Scleropages formosus]
MASLASKDGYLQKLASKVCASHSQERPKRPFFVPFWNRGEAGPRKKRKKNRQKGGGGKSLNVDKVPQAKSTQKTAVHTSQDRVSISGQNVPKGSAKDDTAGSKLQGSKGEVAISRDFSAVDILRQRLHEKIEESRGHGAGKGLSSEEWMKKRERRKQERERKKRKRKEFRMKKLAEKAGETVKTEDGENLESAAVTPGPVEKEMTTLVFNKVDVGFEYKSKLQLKKEKKKRVKGNLTPLTGKNYKQLLSRVEARKAKLEELREKDEAKAKEMEEKMKWTNVLYKAEGLKIKDNEGMLRASLKRKEKIRAQRKKHWEQRSLHVLEKMQHQQDKRRKNIQNRKHMKLEKRKEKARKKGRVLPEDLKKAKL